MTTLTSLTDKNVGAFVQNRAGACTVGSGVLNQVE